MAKSTDFPHSVRHFAPLLNKFSGGHYDYQIFHDFIDYVTACLLFEGSPETAERLRRDYRKDYDLFPGMFAALAQTYYDNLDVRQWSDPLGELYEAMAGRSKTSGFGQFFTPPDVCDMMARMQLEGSGMAKRRINDPACGSGRTLLAANAIVPGNYVYGEDLDPICARMAAINFAMHGCQGQVSCMNSLSQEWRFGFEINPYHRQPTFPPIPHIVPISENQAIGRIEVRMAMAAMHQEPVPASAPVQAPSAPVPEVSAPVQVQAITGTQLTLF